MVKGLCTAVLVIAGCCFALERDATSLPPGGLTPSQVPQFVCIGFDDNYLTNGLKWALDSTRNKVNPTTATPNAATYDGKPVRCSFYVNTNNGNAVTSTPALAAQFKQVLTDGAEIGSHTRTHTTGATTTLATWISEMNGCWTDLTSIGIAKDTVVGFRTPYLIYNANTFKALDSLKFRYDCSIESGFEDSVNGINFIWPYTLDKGSADSAGTGINIGKEPGVWEAPVYCYIVPPALRHQIAVKAKENFDSTTGKITGLDWNMWMSEGGSGGCGMTPAEVLSTLEYDLDQRLAGNRAPFCVGAHTTLYDTLQFDVAGGADTFPKTAGSIKNMRNTISAFIAYALTKPQVRIVPTREMLRWCTNPVALSNGTPVIAGNNVTADRLIHATVAARTVAVSGLRDAGKTVLRLVSLNGREVAKTNVQQASGSAHWNLAGLATGAYLLSIETNGVKVEKKISIQ